MSSRPYPGFCINMIVLFSFMTAVSCGGQDNEVLNIEVQVLSPQGKQASNIEIATIWSANGPTWYDNGVVRKKDGKVIRLEKLADSIHFWVDEGEHQPYPNKVGHQQGPGTYSVKLKHPYRSAIFVMNRARTLGACATIEERSPSGSVSVQLAPLVRVTGRVFCPQADRTPDWTMACVHMPGDSTNQLGFLRCGSVKGEFSLLLPPGEYDLEVYSDSPNATLKVPDGDALDSPRPPSSIRISVPTNTSELDLGTLLVEYPEGTGDYSAYYDRSPPPLNVTDARGVPRDITLESLTGKWVLLEFWAPSCGVCVSKTLPELRKLYEEHPAQRDHFEILSVCCSTDSTFDEFAPEYRAFVDKYWDGKELPFPVLLDGEEKTQKAYGVTYFPTTLLISPEGKLVRWGDIAMLKDELKAASSH